MSYRQLSTIYLASLACLVCICLPWDAIGQAEEAAVTVEVASVPPLERIRPNTDLARVTFTALLHGKPLGEGHVKVELTAPPRTKVLATGFPRVEDTPLLALDSEFRDSTFTLQYLFPIRGTYTLDLVLAPVPGGPVFPSTSLHKTIRIYENPVVRRNAWMLVGGLFVLGVITGVIFSRSAAAREKLLSRVIMVPLVLCCSALAPLSTVAAHSDHTGPAAYGAPERQVIRGDNGWELEIHSSPMPAMVGHMVQLAIWLRKDGEVFPGMMEVSLAAVNSEEAQPVVETRILARQGYTSQSLQLYDGALHTIAVTARPLGGEPSSGAPPTAGLSVDVVALHPPLTVQIRMMVILLGVLVLGMVVGFFVPRAYKEQAGA